MERDTREWEKEFNKTFSIGFFATEDWNYSLNKPAREWQFRSWQENETNKANTKAEMLKSFIHYQLQKAREDWLREEIVRLEDEKFIWLTPEEMKEHDGCRYKKGGLYVGQVAGDNFNGAIQIIQHRYQAELDQGGDNYLQLT